MEPDVRRALIQMYGRQAGLDEAAAGEWLNAMIAGNRYVLDVWAGN